MANEWYSQEMFCYIQENEQFRMDMIACHNPNYPKQLNNPCITFNAIKGREKTTILIPPYHINELVDKINFGLKTIDDEELSEFIVTHEIANKKVIDILFQDKKHKEGFLTLHSNDKKICISIPTGQLIFLTKILREFIQRYILICTQLLGLRISSGLTKSTT